jgi:hypothetical protein
MRPIFLFGFVWFVLMTGSVSAEEIKLSGIMGGDRPGAIINDQIVTVGDSVGNFRIVEIGGDYVVAEGPKGRVTVRLKEEKAAAPKAKPAPALFGKPAAPKPKAAAAPAAPVQVPEKAGRRMDRSMDALRQADAVLKAPIPSDMMYVKAVGLCDEAAIEAQAALKNIPEGPGRKEVQNHLAKISKVKTAIIRDKEELNTRVRTAIVNRQVFQGMTMQNVISSWGVPLTKTTVGAQERWAYKDPNGYQRNLSFIEGILVAF